MPGESSEPQIYTLSRMQNVMFSGFFCLFVIFILVLNLSSFEMLSKLNLFRYSARYNLLWQNIFRKETGEIEMHTKIMLFALELQREGKF